MCPQQTHPKVTASKAHLCTIHPPQVQAESVICLQLTENGRGGEMSFL